MPKMLDLFCGTKSMAKAFEKAGWETYTVDWEAKFDLIFCSSDVKKEGIVVISKTKQKKKM